MKKILIGTHADQKWFPFFALISTKRAEYFLAEIGLNLPTIQPVRECAREFIRDLSAGPQDGEIYEDLLARTFQCIAKRSDEATARNLYEWVSEEFHYSDEFSYMVSTWEIILRDLARNNPQLTPLPLPSDKVERIQNAFDQYLGRGVKSLRSQINDIDNQTLDDWDDELYRVYREATCNTCSPLDILSSAISEYRFPKMWRSIQAILSPSEVQILLEWAKVQAQQVGITSEIKLPEL